MKIHEEQREQQEREHAAAEAARHAAEEEEEEKRKYAEEIRVKDQKKRDDEERELKRVIREAKLKEEEAERDRERERKRVIREAKAKEEEDEREHERLIKEAEIKRQEKARKAQEEKLRIIAEAKAEEEAKKKKEKEEYDAFVFKMKQREQEEKEKKEKVDKEFLERAQREFAKFGMSPKYVESMVKYEEKDKKHKFERENSRQRRRGHSHTRDIIAVNNEAPIYPKIHKDDIEVETLKHYDIAYERASDDRNYYILLEELSVEETDVLFDHTKKIRKERKKRRTSMLPALEAPKPAEYAFVRRRSQTRGSGERSHSHVRDKSPMRERLAERIVRMA